MEEEWIVRIRKVLLCQKKNYTLLEDKTFPANLHGPPQPHKVPSLEIFRLLVIWVSTLLRPVEKQIQYIRLIVIPVQVDQQCLMPKKDWMLTKLKTSWIQKFGSLLVKTTFTLMSRVPLLTVSFMLMCFEMWLIKCIMKLRADKGVHLKLYNTRRFLIWWCSVARTVLSNEY